MFFFCFFLPLPERPPPSSPRSLPPPPPSITVTRRANECRGGPEVNGRADLPADQRPLGANSSARTERKFLKSSSPLPSKKSKRKKKKKKKFRGGKKNFLARPFFFSPHISGEIKPKSFSDFFFCICIFLNSPKHGSASLHSCLEKDVRSRQKGLT